MEFDERVAGVTARLLLRADPVASFIDEKVCVFVTKRISLIKNCVFAACCFMQLWAVISV